MKAIVYHRYGSPDVLAYEETDKPVPGDDEVMIEVRAAALNPLDWHFMRGEPFFIRLMTGLRKPKTGRPGVDAAGWVEAVGRNVTEFKPDEAVFGSCRGALAEFACGPAKSLVRVPESVTFEEAAAAPVAAMTALQGLRDKGGLRAGQKVLVNGAAGGVGTFAVQIARAMGAEVTGVCSARNAEMVRSIGATRVIDYAQEDFTRGKQKYDVILDCHATHGLLACRRVMNPGGIYVGVGAPNVRAVGMLVSFIKMQMLSWMGSRKFRAFIARGNKEDLAAIAEWMGSGQVKPVIDRCYGLDEAAEAMRYLEEGHARGKVVIWVEGRAG